MFAHVFLRILSNIDTYVRNVRRCWMSKVTGRVVLLYGMQFEFCWISSTSNNGFGYLCQCWMNQISLCELLLFL